MISLFKIPQETLEAQGFFTFLAIKSREKFEPDTDLRPNTVVNDFTAN